MTRREELDPSLGQYFSVKAARRAGHSSDRLWANDLVAPYWGARAVIPVARPAAGDVHALERLNLLERCRQYAAVAPETYAFSHWTAARVHGVPMPHRPDYDADLHVMVPARAQPPRRRGVVGHRGLREVQVRNGLRLVPPEQAWLQLATTLRVDDLIIAGDHLVRGKSPLTSLDSVRSAVEDSQGGRGHIAAATALDQIRPGTRSPRETRTRLILVRGGLPEPMVGHTVFDEDGFFVGTPDLAYVAERVAIEYQGSDHWENRDVFEDDILRRELFERARWHVVLVTGRRLRQPQLLVAHIRDVLRSRG